MVMTCHSLTSICLSPLKGANGGERVVSRDSGSARQPGPLGMNPPAFDLLGEPIGCAGVPAMSVEEPAARFEAFGPGALSDGELLAVAAGIDRAAGVRILGRAGSLAGLARMSAREMERAGGLKPAAARRLAVALEIWRRAQSVDASPVLSRPQQMAEYFAPLAAGLQVEKFWAVTVNRKLRVIRRHEISSGTATATLVHPREVFRAAVQDSATGVICCHNHPSGDPAPSAADQNITRQLRDAAKTLDIELLDHVVIGRLADDPVGLGYFSFREGGLI